MPITVSTGELLFPATAVTILPTHAINVYMIVTDCY